MKKILSIFSIIAVVALVMTACNSKPAPETQAVSFQDTVGLSQFQAWKFQHERSDANDYLQNAVQKTTVPAPRKSSGTVAKNYGSGSMNSGSANTAKAAQKKGWSKAAKGAAIGGGAGAIAGAVLIKKNRVAGGVVGGVIGAGIGYVIGRAKDKKDGRL